MASTTKRYRILLAGCGKLGSRIGLTLADQHHVWGLRRSAAQVPPPLRQLQADLLDRAALAAVLPTELDVVIFCLSPGTYDDAGYRAAYVLALDNLLTELEAQPKPPAHVFFISSTAVYRQNDDSWVDESSPTEPDRFSGIRVLEGERRLAESPLPGTAVRFSGIYGRARRGMLARIQAGKLAPDSSSADSTASPFTNRIHEDDCVGIMAHLVARHAQGEILHSCYLASDCEPVRQGELVAWVRSQADCAPVEPGATAAGRAGSKRCDNRRVRASGYVFRYPSFREGYSEMLRNSEA